MLAGVYGWFTEGLDTPDLREAKSFLGELSDHARARRAVGSSDLPELSAALPTKKQARPRM
jgi:hypothetical protein